MQKSSHSIWGERYVPAWGPKDGFGIREGEDVLGLNEEERDLWENAYTDPQRAVIAKQRDARRLKEHQEREAERERQEWTTSRAAQLLKKLGECFAEYKECLEHDPRLQEKALAFDEMNQKIFNRIRTTMERAHQAPRCRHPKAGGGTCRARTRQKILPYARDAGRGEAGEDQFTEPGRCERDPWSDCQRSAGGGGWKTGLQAGVNTGVLPATGIEQY